nr:unnamed protein product [Callosobruchus analis]
MQEMESLRIITWNCNNILSKQFELKLLINQYSPHIIALNETHLSKNNQLYIPNYTNIRKDRHDGRGGIAILIHINTPFQNLNVRLDYGPYVQMMTIRVAGINFLNIYCPPSIALQIQEYLDILELFSGPTIISGDLNTQHQTWRSTHSNLAGRRLFQAINTSEKVILNDGSRTRVTIENTSCPDLTIASPELAHKTAWFTHDNSCFSDHIPIIISIADSYYPCLTTRQNKWNTRKADWNKYREHLSRATPTEDYNNWKQQILQASEESIPKTTRYLGRNKYPPKPVWWDEECEKKLDIRR